MPGMNGVEFLNRIKQASPGTQRIMLTGLEDQHAIEDAVNRWEIFRFVSKPSSDAQLLMTVQSAFEQYVVASENERLQQLTQKQNEEFRRLNAELEERVTQRTHLLIGAKREWEMSFDSIELPLAVVHEDFSLRRANLAYARTAEKQIQEVARRPRCYQFLFGRIEPCPGCPFSLAMKSGQERRTEVRPARACLRRVGHAVLRRDSAAGPSL